MRASPAEVRFTDSAAEPDSWRASADALYKQVLPTLARALDCRSRCVSIVPTADPVPNRDPFRVRSARSPLVGPFPLLGPFPLVSFQPFVAEIA